MATTQSSPERAVPWWGLVASIIAPIALIGGWTLAAAVQPGGFDTVHGTLSALQASATEHHAIMNVAFAITGLCHIVTSLALRTAAAPGRIIYAFGGAATIAIVLAPLPYAGGSSAAHGTIALISFVCLGIWPVFARDRTGSIPALTGAVPIIAGAVLGVLVVLFLIAVSVAPAWLPIGLTERVCAGAEAIWPLIVTFTGFRSRRSQAA